MTTESWARASAQPAAAAWPVTAATVGMGSARGDREQAPVRAPGRCHSTATSASGFWACPSSLRMGTGAPLDSSTSRMRHRQLLFGLQARGT
jgi:hypothetical protein